jgi:hypothetical protein
MFNKVHNLSTGVYDNPRVMFCLIPLK